MTYLVLRLTSLGNVAMTVPVIASLSKRYPSDRFVVVAKKPLKDMFYGLQNVIYHEVTLATDTFIGIKSLQQELSQYHPDSVIDLQNSTATRILRAMFRWQKTPTYAMKPTKAERFVSEFERYKRVFSQAGLETDDTFATIDINPSASIEAQSFLGTGDIRRIGIAPFAKYKSNMLAYRVTKELIYHYSSLPQTQVYLFGAGAIECEMLSQWASIFPNVTSVAGKLPLCVELELMRHLDVMICMDSANQHLSSLVGLRAVSIWCGSHPCTGFSGWKQNPDDIIQDLSLTCRPCTTHGTNRCRYHNFACTEVTAQQIIEKADNKSTKKDKVYE